MFAFIVIFLSAQLMDFTRGNQIVVGSEREQINNAGTEFVFALSENYALRYNATIIIINKSPFDVHANVSFNSDRLNILENVTIPFGKHKTVDLPNGVVLKRDEGITIQSGIAVTSDNDVTVQVYNDVHQRSMDGFLALPTRALGKEYYVMAYDPWIQSQLAVVAIEDGTEIDVISAMTFQFMYSTKVYAGSRIRIDVNRLEAVQLQCPLCDFSGTRIVSNKPIAVMTGNRCTFVPSDVSSCDHLVEQIPPVNQWGKTFVASPLMGRAQTGGNRFRVLAARYGTEVAIGADYVTLKPGQFYDFELASNETTLVVSNKPVLLVQYSSGLQADNVTGDPSMTIVPSLEQRVNEATFVTYDKTKEKTDVTNYISVYADCRDFDNISLDGRQITTIPDTEFAPVELTDYCVASVLVFRKGMHSLTGDTNTTTFSAILYGFAEYNSFAHPVVMGLRDILCTSVLPDNSTIEHNCDEPVIAIQLPCWEDPTDVSDMECSSSDCLTPLVVIAIGVGCAISALFIENVIRMKCMKKHDYLDKRFYTPKELYHRKAVVRREEREQNQAKAIYK